jgi:hypothetical protein
VHLRETLRTRGLIVISGSWPDGTGAAGVDGPAWGITDELIDLLRVYHSDLVAEALNDPLVIYAQQMLEHPHPSCGCFGAGHTDDDAAGDEL